MSALARIARASKVHFLRTLQTTFGTTPHRCLQRRRFERSMGPLRETDCRVTEICLDVAYTSLGAPGRVGR
ncbi:MAG: helix-turn-helix transcriptional regulator [Thermoanaerobaculia bacterium]|nr:MAG: helix-turn-helix transcriptional regulator [Thermoanaerobaculia bacterium]